MPVLWKVLLGIVVVAGLSQPPSSPQAESIAAPVKPRVGVIVAERGEGISSGTAFAATERLALTAYHLVAGSSRIILKFPNSSPVESRVIATDIPNDVAVLALPDSSVPPLPLGDSALVRQGDKVVMVSSHIEPPDTQTHLVTDGLVLSADAGLLRIQTPITPQNGGGLVLNLRGQMIGLVRRQVREDQNGVNLVTPTSVVKPILGAALFIASVPPVPSPSPGKDLAAAASSPPTAEKIPSPPSLISAALSADPFLISPGQSIGSVRLGMPIQDVVALLGVKKNAKQLPAGGAAYNWFEPPQNEGIGVRVTAAGVVDRIWAFNDAKYTTKDLLRPGSTDAQVRAALGEPSGEDVDSQAKTKTLRYEALGLWFTIQLDPQYKFYNAVFEIGVMLPK